MPARSGEVSLREMGGISGRGLQKTPGGAVALELGEADEDWRAPRHQRLLLGSEASGDTPGEFWRKSCWQGL